MQRDKLKSKLLKFGYKEEAVYKLLQGKNQPTAKKMFQLKDTFNIPLNAWRDIKSYLQDNNTKQKA